MKILLTGANGYIGTRLLPVLVEAGHEVVALVRSKQRFKIPDCWAKQVTIVVADLLQKDSLKVIPKDVEAAYYLVHSMGQHAQGFSEMEALSACNFAEMIAHTQCEQVIYLSGLSKKESVSEHMQSRRNVEDLLRHGKVPVTVLRAGIIIGSGSASFEIIRDLVEKLPIMVAPKWVASKSQPIGIADVITYLSQVLGNPKCKGRTFEIGGPDRLTYRQMLEKFAQMRGLRRWIIQVPVLTPRLSSYWLIFITSTSFPLAQALVNSLKADSVCSDHSIEDVIRHQCMGYDQALKRAFDKIEQHAVISSWKDAMVRSQLNPDLTHYVKIPTHGCLQNQTTFFYDDRAKALERLWNIGGENGWYYMNWAWKLRGWVDRMTGGVGLRRGRTHAVELNNGDALDFWRVLRADKKLGYLLLYAEMRVPGEAWLEYYVAEGKVRQKATFRPRGVLGRLYWYLLLPIHYLIFRGMCRIIARGE